MDAQPGLTGLQRRLLVDAARASLHWHLRGVSVEKRVEDGAGLGNGAAFVTLKKAQQLRGCVGNLDATRPLLGTVQRCAVLAASDSRFAPVRADEIDALEIIVSILGPFLPIDDPRQIVIGSHGLLVRLDNASGVLLPEVAVEHGLNEQGFLQSVCRKAGLPVDAWKSGASVLTFTTSRFSSAKL